MYGAFLSYTQLNEYLSLLDELELIKYMKNNHGSSQNIVITEKGMHFLDIYDRISVMISPLQAK